jgi:hypothetical protein
MKISGNVRLTWLEVLVGCLLMGLIVVEFLVYSPPIQRIENSLTISGQSVRQSDQSTTVRLAISGASDQDLRVLAFPLSDKTVRQLSIFVYDDPSFPVAGVAPLVAQGVPDHLDGELLAHHYGGSFTRVTASELATVFRDTGQAGDRVVVMMTGVLPATVFALKADLVSPWVLAGGTLVWGGGAIGFWSGVGGQSLSATNALGEAGTERLLGSGVVQYPTTFGRTGTSRSSFGSALDVSYRFASAGVLRDPVLARGGLALGWYSGPFSSVSYLPRGQGGYLIFGGEILDEASASVDLTRILLSGAIYAAGPVAFKEIRLSKANSSSVVDWELPFAVPKAGVMLVAFDPNPDSIYFSRSIIGH